MNKSNTLWILTTCVVVICVVIYIANGIKNESSSHSTQSPRPSSSSNSDSRSDYSSSTTNSNKDYSYSKPALRTSTYKDNQLTNGSSPLDGCFGKGVYSGNATLTIKNGSSADAIVCLYNLTQSRTIRNEYVQKNTSFRMDNIAQGYYKIRVFYGNDWNPTLKNSCGSDGSFESDVSFSEFDGQQYFEDSNDGYTMATVTLYTVANGNASTSRISQSNFFSN